MPWFTPKNDILFKDVENWHTFYLRSKKYCMNKYDLLQLSFASRPFFLYKFNFKDTDNSLDSIRRKATIFILFTLSKIFRHLSAVLHLRWIYCALIAVHVITRVLHDEIRTAKINFLLLVIPQRMIMIQSSAEVV